jgi:hypothetical protein
MTGRWYIACAAVSNATRLSIYAQHVRHVANLQLCVSDVTWEVSRSNCFEFERETLLLADFLDLAMASGKLSTPSSDPG